MFIKISDSLINLDGLEEIMPDQLMGRPCITVYRRGVEARHFIFSSVEKRGRCWDSIKARLALTGSNIHFHSFNDKFFDALDGDG